MRKSSQPPGKRPPRLTASRNASSRRTPATAAADAAGGKEVLWLPNFSEALTQLNLLLRAGDSCLILGAGDVRSLGEDLVVEPSSR